MTKEEYSRTLHFNTGVLTRSFVFTTSEQKKVKLTYERFACQHDKNLLACRILICSDSEAECEITGTLRTADGGEKLSSGEDAIYLPLSLSRGAENESIVCYRIRRSGFPWLAR